MKVLYYQLAIFGGIEFLGAIYICSQVSWSQWGFICLWAFCVAMRGQTVGEIQSERRKPSVS